jgi:hypothetical protein
MREIKKIMLLSTKDDDLDLRLTCKFYIYVSNIVNYGHAKFHFFMINAFCQKVTNVNLLMNILKLPRGGRGKGRG